MRVLIVEDERGMAGLLKRGLEEENHSVSLAFNGREALEFAGVYEFDAKAAGVKELIWRTLPEGSHRIGHELAENAELRRGMEFLQVADAQGRWIYRSPLMSRYGISLARGNTSRVSVLKAGHRRLRVLAESEEVSGAHFQVQVADHLFDRFYRADKAREKGGAGLGLSIGRWIAEAHGGKIDVESEPRQGSVFRVRLPIARG
ncbi:MAG: ATP-binding protein [Terriglobia bacterium]